MLTRFANRTVVEMMTLTFTALIAFVVVLGALLVAIAEILDPATDTTQIVDALSGIVTGILGALLGLLAGKADAVNQMPPPLPPKDEP